jgi:hypothetical protein
LLVSGRGGTMKKLLVTALLLAASLLVVGTSLTANATSKTTPCKTVKFKVTRQVWNAKHTKKITVDVFKLVKETVKVKGKTKVVYVKVQVYKETKICTAAISVTSTTVAPVPVTTTTQPVPPTVIYYPAPTTTMPAPTTTTTTVPSTTTTTTTTVPPPPPPPPPGMTISTIFINPAGVVQVTGTFVNVTSLTFCTDPVDPTVPTAANSPSLSDACTPTTENPTLGTFCSAAIVNGSAECTLPGFSGYLGPGINLCACDPGHPGPFSLTITSTAGGSSFYVDKSSTGYWEYPVPSPPPVTPYPDGPLGAVTVVSDSATTSTIQITGEEADYPDVAGSDITIFSVVNTAIGITTSTELAEINAPVGAPGNSTVTVVSLPVSESLATLEADGLEIGWSGGQNNDGEYGFPSLDYPYWTTNEIVHYDSGAWYEFMAPTLAAS